MNAVSQRKETIRELNHIRDRRERNELTITQAQFQAKMELLSFITVYFPDVAEAFYEADDSL